MTRVVTTEGIAEGDLLRLPPPPRWARSTPSAAPSSPGRATWGSTCRSPPASSRSPVRESRATVDGHRLLLGNRTLLGAAGVPLDGAQAQGLHLAADGATALYVAVDGAAAGVIAVADTLKPESPDAVAQLGALGLDVWMLSGDNRATALAVARQAGIDPRRVVAGVSPDGKAAQVRALQADGRVVAMVGDGINDAPALAQADLGIAIGTGADVAMAASDVTLIGGDLRTIVTAIALSRRTVGAIRQGLFWAFAYNVLLIPVAMGALYPLFGVLLSPVLAAAAMAMSSVSVVTNALRLRRFRRPTSVAAILRPPLVERVKDYAFLVGIALLALGAGALALYLAQPGHRPGPGGAGAPGMSDTSGMPAMSAPVSPAAANRRASLDAPEGVRPGEPARLTYRLADATSGAPVTDVVPSHEQPVHLIAVRATCAPSSTSTPSRPAPPASTP